MDTRRPHCGTRGRQGRTSELSRNNWAQSYNLRRRAASVESQGHGTVYDLPRSKVRVPIENAAVNKRRRNLDRKLRRTTSKLQAQGEHKLVFLGRFGLAMRLESDFEPYGKRSRETDPGPDCSCGCRYFIPLAPSSLASDWGCCVNQKSPRAGLLTWEHMGCKQHEYGPIVAE